jgi:cell division inhibitor SepF
MNFWGRTLVYLGLREEVEDHLDWQTGDAADDDWAPHESARAAAPSGSVGTAATSTDRPAVVRVQRIATGVPQSRVTDVSNVRALRGGLDVSTERVAVVQVQVFDDVEAIGTRYRLRNPVLFDVSGCSRDVARRVVDFVSGLTFASRGSLRRTAPKAFLLVPEGIDIPLDERRRLAQLGYDVDGVAR